MVLGLRLSGSWWLYQMGLLCAIVSPILNQNNKSRIIRPWVFNRIDAGPLRIAVTKWRVLLDEKACLEQFLFRRNHIYCVCFKLEYSNYD
jgi:hypothetical protein